MSDNIVNDLKSPEIEVFSKEIIDSVFSSFEPNSSFQIHLNKHPKNLGFQDSWDVDLNRFKN